MKTCRLCSSKNLTDAIDLGAMPIAHRMRKRQDEAEQHYPQRYVLCRDCGLMQIADPIDPEELYREFNFCFSGWKPQPHIAAEFAMISRTSPGKSMLEIGSNDGLFLIEARKSGFGPLLGIEPNRLATEQARSGGLSIVNEMLTPALAADLVAKHGRFDTVVVRQVLEHLLDIPGFFTCVDLLLAPQGILFVDVPDVEQGMRSGDATMLWEEHVNSFTTPVLESALARFGFAVVESERYNFSGGTIAVAARRGAARGTPLDLEKHLAVAGKFAERVEGYQKRLKSVLSRARDAGFGIVLYGAGNRACTLTNSGDLKGLIDYAVDDQLERQGLFMPGTGIPVRPSAELAQESRPFLCLLAVNNEHETKVTAKVRELARAPAHIFTGLSPADIHAELDRVSALLDRENAP
ncbi:MAG: class I SAM-dependent methyltransferase [Reyranella sp.]|nr:class I SAM-dependent methyltransferase [Reyranella sp.]